MDHEGRATGHEKFEEWSAYAQGRMLTSSERDELEMHLLNCGACREVYNEYALIGSEGMTLLGAQRGHANPHESWDPRRSWERVRARIREAERSGPQLIRLGLTPKKQPSRGEALPSWNSAKYRIAWVGIAACALVTVAAGAYSLGGRTRTKGEDTPSALSATQRLAAEKMAVQESLAAQTRQISQLEKQVSNGQQELAGLRAAGRAADESLHALLTANSKNQEQLRQVSEQRDKIAGQLRDAEQSYQAVQMELSGLRAEHDRALLRTTALESKTEELNAELREQERKLRDNEQYLASDRDIRELMGARKLYIADVFDVDSRSRTRKPFGRVFYTQNKSLIFYAFDLDHEPGVKNASTFQVWGGRDNEPAEKSHATNLGILYMDSESNRRWVLRLDDPKQLAEIDAVFVTVEPHGGSEKPTGKPLLYALLRKEANHP